MTQKKRRKHRMPSDIDKAIEAYAVGNLHWSAGVIYHEIEANPDFKGRVPHRRTVERAVEDFRAEIKSEDWHIGLSSGEDGRHILEARVEAVMRHSDYYPPFTKFLSTWISKILQVVPDYPYELVWLLAAVYGVSVERGDEETVAALNDYLAFTPWRGELPFQIYDMLLQLKRVKPVPMDWLFVGAVHPDMTIDERKEKLTEIFQHVKETANSEQESDNEGNSQEARE